jgi:hypothetical protein
MTEFPRSTACDVPIVPAWVGGQFTPLTGKGESSVVGPSAVGGDRNVGVATLARGKLMAAHVS